MTIVRAEQPKFELTGFYRTLLSQLGDDEGKTLGPIAGNVAHSYIPTKRKRQDAVRGGLIDLENAGLAETVSVNPRRWRRTAAGRAAIS